jgi:hypothetical protein
MQKYGLRIGNIGLEFSDKQTRDKAIQVMTNCSAVSISTSGIRYEQNDGCFSVYDRDNTEVQVNCYDCKGVFANTTCSSRSAPKKDWNGKYDGSTENASLCDACLATREKQLKEWEAKKVLDNMNS